MTDLHELSALECAAAVRAREVSPVELVGHALARTEELDELGAFVHVTPHRALEEARAAEALVGSTSDPRELPPLLGVPTAIKDLNQVAGVPTAFGSATMAGFVAPYDDTVVRLLREAGAISIGKTATPEFGLACYTETEIGPPARNPWDRDRTPGGSSGGAGAAVAAGIVPVAQGSDGAGSIRIPASCCGLVGLKTSRGRVSRSPFDPDITRLSVLGPLAHTVRDAAAFLDAVAGPQLGDPDPLPRLPAGETFLGWCDRDVGRLRIGRFIDAPMSVGVEPEVFEAWEQASALLVSLGHEVVDIPPPLPPEAVAPFETVWSVSSATMPIEPSLEHALTPLAKYLRARGRAASGVEFADAMSQVKLMSRDAILATAQFDALVSPTLAQLPKPIGFFNGVTDAADDFERQKAFTPFTSIFNATGQPAISLPLYQSRDGLPIGIMLAGRPAGEALLLALAAQIEAALPWRDRRPPVW
ncbi:MAG TPA: amidase [Jatrophihabitantaceae bacterium]|nr:amidase [Jatrophihabitantaceae bacterium]